MCLFKRPILFEFTITCCHYEKECCKDTLYYMVILYSTNQLVRMQTVNDVDFSQTSYLGVISEKHKYIGIQLQLKSMEVRLWNVFEDLN